MRHGTWQETGGGGGGGPVVVAVLVLLMIGSGAAAAIVGAIVIAAGVIVGLIALGAIAAVVYLTVQHRRDKAAIPAQYQPVLIRQLPAQERPAALEPPGPRELHQHWHFHGVDEDRVAEILGRHQAPE